MPHLSRIPWLIHGFSTRAGGFSRVYGKGDLNLGFTKDDLRAAVERNRIAFMKELGAVKRTGRRTGKSRDSFWPLITVRQIHSDIIRCVDSISEEPLTGDGLITATPHLLLAIQTADCLPVILVDTKRYAIGVFHAGWRGTVQRIVEKGVGEMHRCFGTRPRDLKAAIGPGIQGCCYAVGEEVRIKFESQFEYGASLFREVKDSDPVREKYPLLFLTARAPGHSELAEDDFSGSRRSEPPTVARSRSVEEEHRNLSTLHELSSRTPVFLSSGEGQDGPDDGSRGNPGMNEIDDSSGAGSVCFFFRSGFVFPDRCRLRSA